MPGYFAAADGVALPSQEYFSIVMLEAMLLERPLIASVHGGSRDVITNGANGLLVDHNDVTQLAQAVARLVGTDAAARRVAQRLLTIYHEAMPQ